MNRINGMGRDLAEHTLESFFTDGSTVDIFSFAGLEAFHTLECEDRAMFDAYTSRLNRDERAILWRRLNEHKQQGNGPEAPRIATADDLLQREFEPIRWLVPGLLPEGLMLLAARPKIGKSWLALQLGLAVAGGGELFGRPVEQGRVLYLALEDTDRRMRNRIEKLGAPAEGCNRFHYATEWPQGAAGARGISEWISKHADARLVVIDVFTKLREASDRRESAYAADYREVAMLKPPAGRDVSVVLVHHTRKADSDDPLDEVSGTLGIGGAADGAWILKRARGESEAELHLIGRDLEDEGAFAVRFERQTCKWEWLGEAWKVRISQERRAVIDVLTDGAMVPHEIAKALRKDGNAVRALLFDMVRDHQIDRGMDGRYRAIEVQS